VFQGSDTGVFVGCMWLEYGELLTAHGAGGGAFVVTGNGLAFLAGRLSYIFGFTGPCVPTNTGVRQLHAQLQCQALTAGLEQLGFLQQMKVWARRVIPCMLARDTSCR